MRFLLDVNVGSTIAAALTSLGHGVARVAAVSPSASDEGILAHAVRDGGILITGDRDFGELVFRHRATPPPAIIYIRFYPEEVADVVLRLLPILDEARLTGHMTVIAHENTRSRAFPGKS